MLAELLNGVPTHFLGQVLGWKGPGSSKLVYAPRTLVNLVVDQVELFQTNRVYFYSTSQNIIVCHGVASGFQGALRVSVGWLAALAHSGDK